jgi:hypothetical protein
LLSSLNAAVSHQDFQRVPQREGEAVTGKEGTREEEGKAVGKMEGRGGSREKEML